MATFRLPYGKSTMQIAVPDENLAGVLESRINAFVPEETEESIVRSALDHPIGSIRLDDIAIGKKNAVIVTSDHTRPVPSRITMPVLLDRLRRVNPSLSIRILVATGLHRQTTQPELIEKFGGSLVEQEKIIIHDSRDFLQIIHLGKLPSGGDLWINRTAAEAELLIAEGFIEPHLFAGFSGGRKSILPGIAGYQTVLANHCSKFISNPFSRAGVLDRNPIHQDMLYAAERANLSFILNVALNLDKRIIRAFAGDREKAHAEGCGFVLEMSQTAAVEADIVIVSNGGYPMDRNVSQVVKGMTAAEATCREGGVIIMIAACNDGHGGQSFYDHLADASSPLEILNRVETVPMAETVPDQWEFQILARILVKHTVILVTDQCDPKLITSMHMEHAYTPEAAMMRAFDMKGMDAKVAVIPDGASVIVA